VLSRSDFDEEMELSDRVSSAHHHHPVLSAAGTFRLHDGFIIIRLIILVSDRL
jgi:hypothetical protein